MKNDIVYSKTRANVYYNLHINPYVYFLFPSLELLLIHYNMQQKYCNAFARALAYAITTNHEQMETKYYKKLMILKMFINKQSQKFLPAVMPLITIIFGPMTIATNTRKAIVSNFMIGFIFACWFSCDVIINFQVSAIQKRSLLVFVVLFWLLLYLMELRLGGFDSSSALSIDNWLYRRRWFFDTQRYSAYVWSNCILLFVRKKKPYEYSVLAEQSNWSYLSVNKLRWAENELEEKWETGRITRIIVFLH